MGVDAGHTKQPRSRTRAGVVIKEKQATTLKKQSQATTLLYFWSWRRGHEARTRRAFSAYTVGSEKAMNTTDFKHLPIREGESMADGKKAYPVGIMQPCGESMTLKGIA